MEITPGGSELSPTLLQRGIRYISASWRSLIGDDDDLAIAVLEKNVEVLQLMGQHALYESGEWMVAKILKFAPHKTKLVLLVGARKTQNITMNVKGAQICSQNSLRYHGVHMNRMETYAKKVRSTNKYYSIDANEEIAENSSALSSSL